MSLPGGGPRRKTVEEQIVRLNAKMVQAGRESLAAGLAFAAVLLVVVAAIASVVMMAS